jgi:hypothetical protein
LPTDPGPATLRVRIVRGAVPRVRVADPDRDARLVDVPVEVTGDYASATLPPPGTWQLVLVELDPNGTQ